LNERVFKMLELTSIRENCGLRPGELFRCVHVEDGPNGCGTSVFCKECGFVNAILESNSTGAKVQKECRLRRKDDGKAIDLLVAVSPIEILGENFSIATLSDISAVKRKELFERLFFHDMLNLAGGIQGLAELLKDQLENGQKELAEAIDIASNSLISEIQAQKTMKLAEDGDLTAKPEPLDSAKLLKELASVYARHEVADGKRIAIGNAPEIQFSSDKGILERVIGNMLKNALEASPLGGQVTIGCADHPDSGELEFHVDNQGVIPESAQRQIFNRSFSTNGTGRGQGTHSMKLLGEKYLKGRVDFISAPEIGTTFRITLKKSA
jgi:signal transduction histidine kinase